MILKKRDFFPCCYCSVNVWGFGLPSLALAMNTINSTIKMRALTRVKFLS